MWLAAAAAGLGYALWATAASIRRDRIGVDVIAVLALAGAIAVGKLLAAAVIGVMVASGRALEEWAARRAQRDLHEVADAVGVITGVDEVFAELTPAGKLDVVRREQRHGPVIMTGDGINDAPALALAYVGVAMGARGSTASSEAADAVLTVDCLSRLGEVAALARRTRRIALQSVLAGMGMSLAAMGLAAASARAS